MKKSLFNKDIKPEILAAIGKAKHQINLAVAWISDKDIIDALVQCAKRNVKVTVILSAASNPIIAAELEKEGGSKIHVYVLGKTNNNLMHHKFCVIDNAVLITGSYNYTANAINNDENILVIENDLTVINDFLEEHKKLLSNFSIGLNQPNVDKQRKWRTEDFVADHDDVQHGLTVGKAYTLHVAQLDFKSKSGTEYKKGDWFVVDKIVLPNKR